MSRDIKKILWDYTSVTNQLVIAFDEIDERIDELLRLSIQFNELLITSDVDKNDYIIQAIQNYYELLYAIKSCKRSAETEKGARS